MNPLSLTHRRTPKTLLAAAVVAAASATSVPSWAQSYVPSPEAQNSAITSWWDPTRNTQFVIYMGYYGDIIVLTCGPGGCWQVSAVDPVPSVVIGGLDSTSPEVLPFLGGSPLTGYFDGDTGHIYFIGWELNSRLQYQYVGDLWEEHIDQSGQWSGQSLTAAAHASTQPWNANGDGYAPYLMSSLSSMYVNGRQHVFYAGSADSAIHDTYFDGNWHDVAVTGNFHAPPFMGLDLTSYYDGLEHVYAAGQEYYSDCDECTWYPGAAPAMSGYVVGETHNGVQAIYGVQNYYGWIADNWFVGNYGWYTSYASANNYNPYSPIIAYEDNSDISPRVFYVGGDQHIYQMWDNEDIMQETGAVPAAMGSDDDALSAITGYFDGVNDHVFYIGVDQHVHELYMSSTTLVGGWSLNDLSVSANATQQSSLPSLP
jgi:hypothetical protein